MFWKNRYQFALLMENFINGIIDGEDSDSFSVLHIKTVDAYDTFETDFEKLEDFQPDPKSNGFGSLMTFVYRDCEVLEEEYYTQKQFKESTFFVLSNNSFDFSPEKRLKIDF